MHFLFEVTDVPIQTRYQWLQAVCSGVESCIADTKVGRYSSHWGKMIAARQPSSTLFAYTILSRDQMYFRVQPEGFHGLGRLRLTGPCGAHDEFILAAAPNLKKLAKLAPNQAFNRKTA